MALAHARGSVYKELPLLQFGGLNNRDASTMIDNSQSSDLMNVHFDNRHEITKRNGYVAYEPQTMSSDPVNSLITYIRSDGTTILLAATSTKLLQIANSATSYSTTWNDFSANAWSSFTSTATWQQVSTIYPKTIASNLTNNKRFTYAVYKDILYMMNGSDGLMKYDGSAYSTVSGAPAGKYVLVHKNRLYIAGDPANPSRLYMSDLGAPESFPALNFVDINTNNGDVFTGMAEHLDSLVVFKEKSIHIVRGTGPGNYNFIDSHQSHGTVSHWSIVSILNKLYYLSRDGVYSYDGHHIHLESDLIKGSVLGLNANQAWNQTNLYKACAIEYQNKYVLAVPEGGSQLTNNRIYLLDYTHHYWTRYDISAACLCLFPTSNVYSLYSGSTTVGQVYQQDTGTSDDSAAINAYLRTKDFDFGAPVHFKTFKGLEFMAREGDYQSIINMTYYQDLDKTSKTVPLNIGPKTNLWGVMFWGDAWGSTQRVVSKTTSISGQCRFLSFKVSDNSTNPFTFLGWTVRYQVKRRLI